VCSSYVPPTLPAAIAHRWPQLRRPRPSSGCPPRPAYPHARSPLQCACDKPSERACRCYCSRARCAAPHQRCRRVSAEHAMHASPSTCLSRSWSGYGRTCFSTGAWKRAGPSCLRTYTHTHTYTCIRTGFAPWGRSGGRGWGVLERMEEAFYCWIHNIATGGNPPPSCMNPGSTKKYKKIMVGTHVWNGAGRNHRDENDGAPLHHVRPCPIVAILCTVRRPPRPPGKDCTVLIAYARSCPSESACTPPC